MFGLARTKSTVTLAGRFCLQHFVFQWNELSVHKLGDRRCDHRRLLIQHYMNLSNQSYLNRRCRLTAIYRGMTKGSELPGTSSANSNNIVNIWSTTFQDDAHLPLRAPAYSCSKRPTSVETSVMPSTAD